ncbi:ribonuclease III [Dysgonomonas massiliensis]|uniref:ribonuclease III n=1 Tax=Dysgonomonas massiliensis TaxID=2040292 RepID=UPI000C78502D|nr:ribonuclease III [Dysgonomonas massiliensis]
MFKKLYRKIRLLPRYGKEPYFSFYKILGFYPYNITLYEQALLHKSSSIKLKNGKWINNERLEFLGDAILDAAVADIVFKGFEYKKEGFLTNIRARIVQRETLNRLALDLGVDKLVKSSARTSHNTHMYGNALEALIGAIYLDQGYRVTKHFVYDKLIKEHLDIEEVAQSDQNYKSRLIEWGQKMKIPVTFDLIDSSIDKNNSPFFRSAVNIYDLQLGIGEGYSKKESQQKAASEALKRIDNDAELYDSIMQRKKKEVAEEAERKKKSEEEKI